MDARLNDVFRLAEELSTAKQENEAAYAGAMVATAASTNTSAVVDSGEVKVPLPGENVATTAPEKLGEAVTGVLPKAKKGHTTNVNVATSDDTPAGLDSKRPAATEAPAGAQMLKRQRTSTAIGRRRSMRGNRRTNRSPDSSPDAEGRGAVVMEEGEHATKPVHPVFVKREQATKEMDPSLPASVLDMAFEAGALDEQISACESKIESAVATMEGKNGGVGALGGVEADRLAAEESLQRERLAVLIEKKTTAEHNMTRMSLEAVVAATEVRGWVWIACMCLVR